MKKYSVQSKHWFLPLISVLLAGLACGPIDTARELVGGTFHAYYVSPDGDNENDCQSWEHACLTIDGALGRADDGDAIHVAAGTVSTLEAQVDKRVAIVGMGEEVTTLEWGYPAVLTIDSDVTISDLSITVFEEATEEPPCIAVLEGAALTVTRVTLHGCGNGLYSYRGSETTLEQVTVTGADLDGVFNEGGTVSIRNSRLIENNGRALGNTGTMIVEDTTIDHNLLHPWPAGGDLPKTMITNSGHLELIRSTVSRSPQRGITNGGELILVNSTVSSNHDFGLSNQDGELTLRNVTVADNPGTGIVISGGSADIENTIISGNGYNCFWSPVATPHVSGVNLSEACRYFTESDPLLGPLADNGGLTQTHALLPGSPAVDAALTDCLPEDQRGVERPLGASCDVGAYELDPALASEPVALSAPDAAITVTPAMDLPQVDIKKDTLCFYGPGDPNPVVGSLLGGSSALVRGLGALDDWLVIEDPHQPGVNCWVNRADVEEPEAFDPSGLKVFAVPVLPTTTPKPEKAVGCLVQNPNDPKQVICAPRACTPNDQPGGSCTP
jgi:hypothetical protein